MFIIKFRLFIIKANKALVCLKYTIKNYVKGQLVKDFIIKMSLINRNPDHF